MLKINKGYSLRIISLLASISFLLTTSLYAYPEPKDTLRVPVGTAYQRIMRAMQERKDTNQVDIDGVTEERADEGLVTAERTTEELWPELKKAVSQFGRILSGDIYAYGGPRVYYEGKSDPSLELVRCRFPAFHSTGGVYGKTFPVELQVEEDVLHAISFNLGRAIIAYTSNEQRSSSMEMRSFKTPAFSTCFVAYFFAVSPEDPTKKILFCWHQPLLNYPDAREHYQLFLFVKALMESYGIEGGAIAAAFYGDITIKDEDKKRIRAEFYRVFPGADLYDEHWGVYGNSVDAVVDGNNLNLTAEIGLDLKSYRASVTAN